LAKNRYNTTVLLTELNIYQIYCKFPQVTHYHTTDSDRYVKSILAMHFKYILLYNILGLFSHLS